MYLYSVAPGRCGSNFKNISFKLITKNSTLSTGYETALSWKPHNLADEKSTLVQVMACCCQATNHYLSQCWPRSMSPYDVTRPQGFNWVVPIPENKLSLSLEFSSKILLFQVGRVGGCERVFTPVRWRQVWLSCIKWRSTFFLYFFVRPSFGRQFVIRVDGCCANCVVGLAFLPIGHTTRKQRHYDVRNDAITTSCARWVGLWGRPFSLV